MSATKKSSDEEWDEAASRSEWERSRERLRKAGELTPELESVTWEEIRGFRMGFEIGQRWEREVAAFLRAAGFPAVQKWEGDVDSWKRSAENVLGYLRPPPDLVGIDEWTLELKNRSNAQWVSLGDFVDQMVDEKRLTGDRYGAVISKRRGRPIEDAYVVIRLGDWAQFLLDQRSQRD